MTILYKFQTINVFLDIKLKYNKASTTSIGCLVVFTVNTKMCMNPQTIYCSKVFDFAQNISRVLRW